MDTISFIPGAAPENATQGVLLFVDDEVNILSSLKRLFRSQGYRILTAESGQAGLEIIEREPVDLVVSDMRMPNMNGAQFLKEVRDRRPDVVRMMLTGDADLTSAIDAINQGQIFCYLSKPWEDNDIVLSVRHAMERKRLELEKRRLEEITRQQNEELKRLNAGLEDKVRKRTEELRMTMTFLEQAHDNLKKGFLTSIRIFSNLMEMREGQLSGHSKRVAEHARLLAHRMGLSESSIQDVVFAALLHDIGKIGWPDALMRKPFSALTAEERTEVMKHPVKGETLLMALEQLHGAAKLIRSHHERFDGKGFPDGLLGFDIPLGARILAVVNDYDALQAGTFVANPMKPYDAMQYLFETRGSRYDPHVVNTFAELLGESERSGASHRGGIVPDLPVSIRGLKPGMELARDLITQDGLLLLSRGFVFSSGAITQLINYEESESQSLTAYVRRHKGDVSCTA